MSVYVIAQVTIHDREEYKRYQAQTGGLIARFGGEVLVAEESAVVLEGSWPATRTLIVRFGDEQHARQWYESPEYRDAVQRRHRAAESTLVLVKGLV
jgi:uncharacterized protein (DUF1330 family)